MPRDRIEYKGAREIERIRAAGRVVAETPIRDGKKVRCIPSSSPIEKDDTMILDFDATTKLTYSSGEVPIKMIVGGVNLLRPSATGPWLPLDLLSFATYGYRSVLVAKEIGRFAYLLDEYGGALLYIAEGENILIHSSQQITTVRTSMRAVVDSWHSLSTRAKVWLEASFPSEDISKYWDILDSPMPDGIRRTFADVLFEDCEGCFDIIDAQEL